MFGMLIGVWFDTGKKVKEVKKKQQAPQSKGSSGRFLFCFSSFWL